MLQAQINPHFLYNTLNAIHWMIRAKKNDAAGKMIVELGILLRASFDENPYTTVEKEIDMVKSYIEIQRYRYEGPGGIYRKDSGAPGRVCDAPHDAPAPCGKTRSFMARML